MILSFEKDVPLDINSVIDKFSMTSELLKQNLLFK